MALESTGVYWKLIFNILEADFKVVLVNAKHIKNVPGRKTDVAGLPLACAVAPASAAGQDLPDKCGERARHLIARALRRR